MKSSFAVPYRGQAAPKLSGRAADPTGFPHARKRFGRLFISESINWQPTAPASWL
jgi:hypothetical protein